MNMRRWGLVVASVEMACGLGIAAYFVVLGLTVPDAPDRSAFDRAFPFLLAALGLAGLGAMAWRSARRARTTPTAAHDRSGFPGAECKQGRTACTPRAPTPELSGEGRAERERVVRVARAARLAGVRLAWLWGDQGVWLAVLRATTVEQLNADLAAPDHERWEWVDEQEPVAAGAP